MITVKALFLLAASFYIVTGSPAQADELQGLNNKIAQATNVLGVVHPWEVSAMNDAQEQAVAQLRAAATQLIKRLDYSTILPTLLNQYKEQDGYTRQSLIYVIIQKRDYTSTDLPFLKNVFNLTLQFHYDPYPQRVRLWLTRSSIQSQLADLILIVTGRGEMVGTSAGEYRLLLKDPTAWLAKYAP